MSETNKTDQKPKKVLLQVELSPEEKKAFKEWTKGRYASMTDAIRSYVRKVTGYDPEEKE